VGLTRYGNLRHRIVTTFPGWRDVLSLSFPGGIFGYCRGVFFGGKQAWGRGEHYPDRSAGGICYDSIAFSKENILVGGGT
jgi:hypothetical protein